MRTTALGQTGLTSSVLGFGCSALLGRAGRRDSLRALAASWDAGITLYDTARSYGYGESEALLGEFLRGRRDRAVISTKFGILPAPQQLWKRIAKPAARTLLSLMPSAHGALRKQAATQFTGDQFTVEVLVKSIEESLKKLRTDYVDLLFMHSAPASVLDDDRLLSALGQLVSSGKVRVAGISADPTIIDLTLSRQPAHIRALQFPCNVFDLSVTRVLSRTHALSGQSGPESAPEYAAFANHPFGGAVRVHQSRTILQQLAGSPHVAPELREKLGGVNDSVLADVVLNVILSGTGIHTVIPAMMKIPHLEKNIAAVVSSRFTAEELAQLRVSLTQASAEPH